MATSGSSSTDKKGRRDSNEEEVLTEPLDLMRIYIPSKDKAVSALNVGFMEKKTYVSYVPLSSLILPCVMKSSQADEEEWIERMLSLEEDFTWLLKLPHYRFWSQVVFDKDLQKCLQSYLCHAPRCYEINFSASEELLTHQNKVHKLVFSIFLRMSTYKESKLHHITPSVFGEIAYNSFLFDIPRMMDICVLYGFKNQPLISKMIGNLFATQPKYLEDLDEACATTLMVFDTVEQQLLKLSLANDKLDPGENDGYCSSVSSATFFELLDIINYITDISATLYMYLECYPAACMTFLKQGATTRIPHFYDSILMDVQCDVEARGNGEKDLILDTAVGQLALSKTFFIRAFRNILSSCIQSVLNAKYDNCDSAVHMAHFESYLQVVAEIIIGTIFKYDYNLQFPIEYDLKRFADAGISIDPAKIDYILEGLGRGEMKSMFSSYATNGKPAPKPSETVLPGNKSITNFQDLAASLSASNLKATEDSSAVASPSKPEESIILSLISNVKDILPLGDGFIEACLDYYNYESEKVIDVLLSDGSLPEHLDKLDREMERKPSVKSENVSSVLDERKSIFDYDEFDIFHNDNIPMDRVHLGKSNKTPKVYEMLNDAKESALLKELTLKYSQLGDEDDTIYRDEINLYEDEYDDTYDSVEFSVPEPEAEPELHSARPFVVPRVLEASTKKDALERDRLSQKNKMKDEEEDDDDNEKEFEGAKSESRSSQRKDDFCENPELQRQRYQQRREAQQLNRPRSHQNYHRGGNRDFDRGNNRDFDRGNNRDYDRGSNRDDRGNGRGNDRGSDRDNDRGNHPQGFRNKERYKSNIANHNRRKQADYKRSRGMIPS